MPPTIRRASPDDPAVARLVRDHLADIAPTAPPSSQHALDTDALASAADAGARVWTAHLDDQLAGMIALVALDAGHEELKSMRTAPHLRGRGVGTALLRHALADAAQRSVTRISLETGSMEFFAPARALYLREGFVECPAFGAYPADDPNSVFMTRVLTTPPGADHHVGS